MIKASDVGLEKADYTQDVFADFHKIKEKVLQRAKEKHEEELFNELNVSKNHTVQELIALMTYKGMNIKAHVNPYIFIEVADMLESLQKELQEYRQAAQITHTDPIITLDKIYTEEDL